MRYKVPQDILDATECTQEFSCLSDRNCGEFDMCEVTYTAGKNITFLKSEIAQEVLPQCNNTLPFTNGFICKCPTRYYLYHEYGV